MGNGRTAGQSMSCYNLNKVCSETIKCFLCHHVLIKYNIKILQIWKTIKVGDDLAKLRNVDLFVILKMQFIAVVVLAS